MVTIKHAGAAMAVLFVIVASAAAHSSFSRYRRAESIVAPWLECVSKSPGLVTAYFGFENPTLDEISIPAGPNNQFIPSPPNRSQTTRFLPGRSRYFPVYAFSVSFPESSTLKWQLNGSEVSASSKSKECITRWTRFQMVVDGQNAPSSSQYTSLAAESATQMGCLEAQVLPSVNSVGLNKWQVIFNVTSSNETDACSPIVGVTTLFGDNEKFAAFVNRAIALGLVPSMTQPMPSGQEVQGAPIGAPTPTTPQAPSSPPPTTTPTSPSTPPTTPSAPATPPTTSPEFPPTVEPFTPVLPPAATPGGQLGPSSDAPRREDSLLLGTILTFTVIALLLCAF